MRGTKFELWPVFMDKVLLYILKSHEISGNYKDKFNGYLFMA